MTFHKATVDTNVNTGLVSDIFLSQFMTFNLLQELPIQFYIAVIESGLCTSSAVRFGSASSQDGNRLQWPVRSAETIIGAAIYKKGSRQGNTLCTYYAWLCYVMFFFFYF